MPFRAAGPPVPRGRGLRKTRVLCLARKRAILPFILRPPRPPPASRAEAKSLRATIFRCSQSLSRHVVIRPPRPRLPALGVGMLAYTVWHSGLEATSAPPPTTQAVIRLIEALPDHANTRIFVTESNLRRRSVYWRQQLFLSGTCPLRWRKLFGTCGSEHSAPSAVCPLVA